ncbi:MAG: ABC transporter substrate-binding protein, partial [SAR324 cluster bacterium]|nr:ABC transporter substrate-binding protein [SAR324 cluster bacterium]
MRNLKLIIALLSGLLLAFSSIAFAKVKGDTITLGAAVSLTGKYSTNGKNTKNGYDMAINRINKLGGVIVGGKSYKFKIIYYDDESNGGRAAQLAERL